MENALNVELREHIQLLLSTLILAVVNLLLYGKMVNANVKPMIQ